jgi:transposase-like protein
MTNPTKSRRRFTAQQKQEAIDLCLQEGLSCNAVVRQSREMRGSRERGYNVTTSAGRGHGSSEAGQNRQLERGPSRQADA